MSNDVILLSLLSTLNTFSAIFCALFLLFYWKLWTNLFSWRVMLWKDTPVIWFPRKKYIKISSLIHTRSSTIGVSRTPPNISRLLSGNKFRRKIYLRCLTDFRLLMLVNMPNVAKNVIKDFLTFLSQGNVAWKTRFSSSDVLHDLVPFVQFK